MTVPEPLALHFPELNSIQIEMLRKYIDSLKAVNSDTGNVIPIKPVYPEISA